MRAVARGLCCPSSFPLQGGDAQRPCFRGKEGASSFRDPTEEVTIQEEAHRSSRSRTVSAAGERVRVWARGAPWGEVPGEVGASVR